MTGAVDPDFAPRLGYTADGIVSVFPEGGLFTLPENVPFSVISDVLVVPVGGTGPVLLAGAMSLARRRRI